MEEARREEHPMRAAIVEFLDEVCPTFHWQRHQRSRAAYHVRFLLTALRAGDRLWLNNGPVDAQSATAIQGRVCFGGGEAKCKLYS